MKASRLGIGGFLSLALAIAGCSGLPSGSRNSPQMVMPASISPARIPAAPMAHTAILPASVMDVRPQSASLGQSYTQIPGAASYAAAAPDGSLWALSTAPAGADKFIWHYASGIWTNISGLASQIAVAPNGTLYAINSGGGTYAFSGGTWTGLGGGASAVTTAADGSFYVLSNGGAGPDRAIWHNVSGTWSQVPGSGVSIAGSFDPGSYTIPGGAISPGGLYILNSLGLIYYENTGGSFTQLPANASALATTTTGGVFALGYPANAGGNNLYYYDLNTPGWSAQTGLGVSISSSAGQLYVISSSGGIYTSPVKASAATRPLKAGDAWAYAGTSTLTQVFARTPPTPIAITTSAVTQNVSVTGGASFNGQSGIFDVKTVEVDTSPLQAITVTTDNFMNSVASGGGSNLISWGYTSSDTLGESLNVQYGTTGATSVLLDQLPEVSGANWINNTAERIHETSPGNQTAVRTYAIDGSYTDTTTFPNSSQFTPAPAPQTATIVENADGSGTYSVPFFGGANQTISFSTPSPSNIITVTFPGPSLRTATTWYPLPLHLYTETDTNNGATAIPGACNVSAMFGTTANALVLSTTRVDTILGTVETVAQTTYVVPTYGAACVQLTDTVTSYYDYTGGAPGIKISSTPVETQTVVTTLGLSTTTILSHGRIVLSDGSAAGWRIANARANFLASVERRRIERQRKLFDTFQRTLRDGGRR